MIEQAHITSRATHKAHRICAEACQSQPGIPKAVENPAQNQPWQKHTRYSEATPIPPQANDCLTRAATQLLSYPVIKQPKSNDKTQSLTTHLDKN